MQRFAHLFKAVKASMLRVFSQIRGEFADLIRAAGSGKLVDEEWANIEGKLAKVIRASIKPILVFDPPSREPQLGLCPLIDLQDLRHTSIYDFADRALRPIVTQRFSWDTGGVPLRCCGTGGTEGPVKVARRCVTPELSAMCWIREFACFRSCWSKRLVSASDRRYGVELTVRACS